MNRLDVSGLTAPQAYEYGWLQGVKHRLERGWQLSAVERDTVLFPLGLPYDGCTPVTPEMCDQAIEAFIVAIVKERITT